jgi:hypothetical protein
MATGAYEGDVFTLQETPMISTLPRAALAGGRVYCSIDRCIPDDTGLDAGTTLHVGKLPKGAIVLYSLIYAIDTATYDALDAMTDTVDGSIGITGDTDLFGDFTDLNAATTPQVVIPKPDGTTYTDRLCPLENDVDVYVTTATAVLTATEGIVVAIFYTVGGLM